MKAKKGLILQQIEQDYFLIDSGEELPRFNGMVKLNETSHFIISSLIEKEMTMDELYELFLSNYQVTLEQLKESLPEVIKQLKEIKVILD